MSCSNPIRLYKEDLKPSHYNNHSSFDVMAARNSFGHDNYIEVPCYHCLNCRIDRVNNFIDRAEFELIKYGCGAFVTFTYDDVHLFKNSHIDSHSGKTIASINKKDGKDFLNRLNKLVHKECKKLQNLKLKDTLCRHDYKYVISSEYGDKFNRPHFHCLFFGLDFAYCERLFWRAWKYKGSIQVGAIKNGGIGYCVKYINESSHGINDFYKYTYHHLERPSSSHSINFGSGLYESQLAHIKKTGCYQWHNKERPLPSYYKNKYKVINDLDIKVKRDKYDKKLKNIYSLYETKINSYEEYKDYVLQQSRHREKMMNIKLRQQGKQIEIPELLNLERQTIGYGFNRLDTSHDKSITKVINNQGIEFMCYINHLIKLPLSNIDCMRYFKTDYNHLCRQFGHEKIDKLFGIRSVPF